MAKVLRASPTGTFDVAEKDFGAGYRDVWSSCLIAFDASSLAAWSPGFSGAFMQLFSADPTEQEGVYVFDGQWYQSVGDSTVVASPVPAANTWTLCEFHRVQSNGGAGTFEMYIEGALVDSGDCFTSEPDITQIWVGQFIGTAGAVAYIDDVKVGTTRGATDIFADDFEDGTLDAWTTALGDVSVVDAPSFGPAPASVRTFEGREWKWVVRDLKTSVVLTSITTIATDITTSRLLAAPWPASLTLPADDPRVNTIYEQFDDPTWDEPFVAEGIRVLTGFRDTGVAPLWECAYTGIIDQVYDAPDDGVPYSRISAHDARKYLDYIPLVDAAGELPSAAGISYSSVKANVIARAAVENWIDNNPGCLAETIFDLTNGADEDCVEVTITFGRGTMVGEVWSQLEQMGVIDIVLDPVHDPENQPGVMAVVNFEAEHGEVRPAAIFSWDLSPRSLPEISRFEDGTKRANTIQPFTDDVEPGDPAVDTDSITKYGEYWEQRAWSDQPDPLAVSAFAVEDLLFRKNRQTTLSATPAAARAAQPVQDYDIGDRAPFYASRALRKPIAGRARIYGIPFVIGDDARESVQELIVSADAVVA